MTILTIGKRLVPIDHITLVEPFDPSVNPDFKPEKDYKSRLVLLNRDMVLAEMSPDQFATDHGFLYLAEDCTAISPTCFFWVEIFQPNEKFSPSKPYQSRLKWRDPNGGDQSRLLITEAQTIAAMISGQTEPGRETRLKTTPGRPSSKRRKPAEAITRNQ